jgi:hypothetical protein
MERNYLKKVIQLPLFPTEPTEMKIQSLLEANMNLLFYPGFEEPIKNLLCSYQKWNIC